MQLRSRAGRLASLVIPACAIAAALTCAGSATAARRHLKHVSLTTASEPEAPAPEKDRHAWARNRLPAGGALENGNVVHTIRAGETWTSIAESYVELTSVYSPEELAKALVSENLPASKRGPTPGTTIHVPHVLDAAPKAPERIGIPSDGVVKGLYVRGTTAGGHGFPAFLDRVAEHGMNAIVLDVKDYDGPLTYPSKLAFANDAGAVKNPPIHSYARAVRFAHERGIRVIARVSCFNDQLMAKAHPGMAIRGVSGHPYRNGWLDPQSEMAQAYVADLVREAMGFGVDEIQLDYVRFPVIGMKNIDFKLDTQKNPNAKVEVIDAFVEKIHAITHARGVPLSLDVFGVIAFGKQVDMQNLGQDPAELAKRSEFLSAMVYPSHYDPGYMGFEEPANHPELVGLGVKHMIGEIDERAGDGAHAKIRPWLQAMRHKSTNYGPGYIQDEIRTGDKAGATGWLLWNPGQIYDVAWRAVPKEKHPHAHATR